MVTTRVIRRRVIIQVLSVEGWHEPGVTGPGGTLRHAAGTPLGWDCT